MHSIWIICGRRLDHSSYSRLHIIPLLAHLTERGHTHEVRLQDDVTWSPDELNVVGADALVLVKAYEHRGADAVWTPERPDGRLVDLVERAQRAGVATIAVRQQASDPGNHMAVQMCETWVCAFATAHLREEAERLGRTLVETLDPWDGWVPSLWERAIVQSERFQRRIAGEDLPLQILAIARKRHLGAVDRLREAIALPWQLTVMTDAPRAGEIAWESGRAHELVCQADALLIAASDANSAPIRLLTGLRSGCPVLADPLPSYMAEATPGDGWLPYASADELGRILRWLAADRDRLTHLAARGQLWRNRAAAPDALADWLSLLERVLGRSI